MFCNIDNVPISLRLMSLINLLVKTVYFISLSALSELIVISLEYISFCNIPTEMNLKKPC